MSLSDFEAVIGLEVHIQLKTQRKMFCDCRNDGELQPPNTTICEVCLGHPGTMPVPNKKAIEWAVLMATALNCSINKKQFFDRKNYFYPDLPKGFQISQFSYPIGENGFLFILNKKLKSKTYVEASESDIRIGIERLHLEEDAAKNIHKDDRIMVDYNRSGTPLVEIVTMPDFRSPEYAKIFLQDLRLIARYLGVSDADMEKGHLRCDANISLRPKGDDKLYPKTEIKNLNSFKSVERALEYEIMRQYKIWESNEQDSIRQSTRTWDENSQTTKEMRSKETSGDYRYFPEPDIPHLDFNDKSFINIDDLKNSLPELPYDKRKRFLEEYGLSKEEAYILTSSIKISEYYENIVRKLLSEIDVDGEENFEEIIAKKTAKWMTNKFIGVLSSRNISFENNPLSEDDFVDFMKIALSGRVNSSLLQQILEKALETGKAPTEILEEGNLNKSVDNLDGIIQSVITENPDEVQKYLSGKHNLLQFFIGQVMKKAKGRANPDEVREMILDKLNELN